MRLRDYFTRRLTPSQIVGVLLGVVVLAGVVYEVYLVIAAEVLQAHITSAMPIICSEVRQQRGEIVKALEEYKAQFGTYPPDHVVSRHPLIVDPVTNTLLYELSGALVDPRTHKMQVAGLEPADESYVTNFFQCQGIRNSSARLEGVKQFLSKDSTGWRQLHDEPDVFVLAYILKTDAIPVEVFWALDFTSWRYISSSPTNNPGKYDLWTEIRGKKRDQIIGNWKQVD